MDSYWVTRSRDNETGIALLIWSTHKGATHTTSRNPTVTRRARRMADPKNPSRKKRQQSRILSAWNNQAHNMESHVTPAMLTINTHTSQHVTHSQHPPPPHTFQRCRGATEEDTEPTMCCQFACSSKSDKGPTEARAKRAVAQNGPALDCCQRARPSQDQRSRTTPA